MKSGWSVLNTNLYVFDPCESLAPAPLPHIPGRVHWKMWLKQLLSSGESSTLPCLKVSSTYFLYCDSKGHHRQYSHSIWDLFLTHFYADFTILILWLECNVFFLFLLCVTAIKILIYWVFLLCRYNISLLSFCFCHCFKTGYEAPLWWAALCHCYTLQHNLCWSCHSHSIPTWGTLENTRMHPTEHIQHKLTGHLVGVTPHPGWPGMPISGASLPLAAPASPTDNGHLSTLPGRRELAAQDCSRNIAHCQEFPD